MPVPTQDQDPSAPPYNVGKVAADSLARQYIAGEAIPLGALLAFDIAADGVRVYLADANLPFPRNTPAGYSASATLTGGVVSILTGHGAMVPDAQWDAPPANTDVPALVRLSLTAGKSTLTGTGPIVGSLVVGNVIGQADRAMVHARLIGAPDSGSIAPPTPPGTVNAWYIDNDNGNDTNDGATALTPLKTLEEWRLRVNRVLGQGILLLLMKPRVGGSVYLKKDGFTPDLLDLTDLLGWRRIIARASDFVNDANDRIVAGGITVPGLDPTGYNPVAPITANEFDVQINGGGAPALPVEPAILVKRLRFDPATFTVALRNFCTHIYQNSADHITVGETLPAVPDPSDVFYIEEPALIVATTATDQNRIRQQPVIVGVRTTGTFVLGQAAFCEADGFLAAVASSAAVCGADALYLPETGGLVRVGSGVRVAGVAILRTASIVLQATGLFSPVTDNLAEGCPRFVFGPRGCVLGARPLSVTDVWALAAGTSGQLGSLIGDSAGAARPLRLLASTTTVRLSRSKIALQHTDITGSNGVVIHSAGGQYQINQGLDGLAASQYGLLFEAASADNLVTVVDAAPITGTGTVRDIGLRGADTTPANWTDLNQNDLRDPAGNQVVRLYDTSIPPIRRVHIGDVFGFIGGVALTQYRVIRADAGPLAEADAGTAADAAGILGVSQQTTDATASFPVLLVVDGPTWVEFNAPPTVGDTAYLSTLPGGFGTVTPPAIARKLGTVLDVLGSLGLVDFNLEVLDPNKIASGVFTVLAGADATAGPITIPAAFLPNYALTLGLSVPGTTDVLTFRGSADGGDIDGFLETTGVVDEYNVHVFNNTATNYDVAYTVDAEVA